MMSKQINKLVLLLGSGGLNGTIAVAAASGLFKVENAFSLAVLFLAGPASILAATLSDGSVRERMLAAVIAGGIATIIVVLAAGVGPAILELVNLQVLKIFGGIAIGVIALMVMGFSISDRAPLAIMLLGIICSFLTRGT